MNPRKALRNAIINPRASFVKLMHLLIPRQIMAGWTNHRILHVGLGQRSTLATKQCIDAAGGEIPWYTYPAAEYLRQLDFSEKCVFEFGSGNSTIYWSKRCRQLGAVEDDRAWFEEVKHKLPPTTSYQLCENKTDYVSSVFTHGIKFDVIVVDGKHRNACARAALSCLSETGFIILDNSDWHTETSRLLRWTPSVGQRIG